MYVLGHWHADAHHRYQATSTAHAVSSPTLTMWQLSRIRRTLHVFSILLLWDSRLHLAPNVLHNASQVIAYLKAYDYDPFSIDGTTYSPPAYSWYPIVKYASDLQVSWVRSVSSPGTTLPDPALNSVTTGPDGSIYITGTCLSISVSHHVGVAHCFLTRIFPKMTCMNCTGGCNACDFGDGFSFSSPYPSGGAWYAKYSPSGACVRPWPLPAHVGMKLTVLRFCSCCFILLGTTQWVRNTNDYVSDAYASKYLR